MAFKDFIKLVLKFIIIFGVLIWFVGGSIFVSYKFLKGDFSISNSIGKIIDNFKDKPRINGVILGTDKSNSRTDFIMFISYNPNNYKLNVISIPRDTYVSNSIDHKINSLYLKGDENKVLSTVQSILRVPLKYYAVVELKGFREIVDEIGGIPMNVPTDMKYYDPYQNLKIDINKGYQVLDGKDAEGFVRYRSGYANADLGRIKAQQLFIKAAIDQFLKPSNIPKIPSIINIILKNVKSNVPKSEILKYVDDVVKIKKENIVMQSLPGEPKYINGRSYFIYDRQKVFQIIKTMLNDSVDEKTIEKRNSEYSVEVLNGTGIPGLASKTAAELKKKGFKIVRIGNSQKASKTTKIIERTSKSAGEYVKEVLNVGKISKDYNENIRADVTVIVGEELN